MKGLLKLSSQEDRPYKEKMDLKDYIGIYSLEVKRVYHQELVQRPHQLKEELDHCNTLLHNQGQGLIEGSVAYGALK